MGSLSIGYLYRNSARARPWSWQYHGPFESIDYLYRNGISTLAVARGIAGMKCVSFSMKLMLTFNA